jgi:hypothetical protein
MRWHCPVVQADELILEDKDDTNPCVESAKVVRHQRKTESRSTDILRRPPVNRSLSDLSIICGNDLLQKSALVSDCQDRVEMVLLCKEAVMQ